MINERKSLGQRFKEDRDRQCGGCRSYYNSICNLGGVFYIGDDDCLQEREASGLKVNWEEGK